MIIYNAYGKTNSFGFDDISRRLDINSSIRSRNIKRAASCSRKHFKNKLTRKNIVFLQSLGLKVKRN